MLLRVPVILDWLVLVIMLLMLDILLAKIHLLLRVLLLSMQIELAHLLHLVLRCGSLLVHLVILSLFLVSLAGIVHLQGIVPLVLHQETWARAIGGLWMLHWCFPARHLGTRPRLLLRLPRIRLGRCSCWHIGEAGQLALWERVHVSATCIEINRWVAVV